MALSDFQQEMETCCRCSACKFIPLERVTSYDNLNGCPSIARFNFHAYSGGGRLSLGTALLEKEITYSEKLLEIIYNCQMCGACDVSCKYAMDMEVLAPIQAMRIDCVEKGHSLPVLDDLIADLDRKGTMVPGARGSRGAWANGFGLKDYTREPVDVVFHAGCRTAFDEQRHPAARAAVTLMLKAGVDVGIAGGREICCGGRAYQWGYEKAALQQAERNMMRITQSGAKTLVTGCAECYQAFKVLYDKFQLRGDLEILHTSEYFARLLDEDRLNLQTPVAMKVTYQDPCYLGRLGEPYNHWKGTQIPGHIRLFDPPREFNRGSYGVYEPPRAVLNSIPGLKLAEMSRTKEFAWCCGAGGGVTESNPEFALWTAEERIHEAERTGAQAIVTTCPGCARNLSEAARQAGSRLKLYDLAELLEKASA